MNVVDGAVLGVVGAGVFIWLYRFINVTLWQWDES